MRPNRAGMSLGVNPHRISWMSVLMALAIMVYADLTSDFHDIPNYAYVFPVLFQAGLLSWGSVYIGSNFHLKTICKGEVSQPKIALTFDDGPHPKVTLQILDVLREFNVKATFFCIGKQVEAYPDIVKRAYNEGHIIANHSYHHGNFFDLQSYSAIGEELVLTNAAIMEAIEQTPRYFRPPYGVTTPALGKAVKRTGMSAIGWSLRSMDTVSQDSDKLIKKVTSRIKPGDIVLFHDTQDGTVLALKGVLQFCNENHIQVVPLNELTNTQAYE